MAGVLNPETKGGAGLVGEMGGTGGEGRGWFRLGLGSRGGGGGEGHLAAMKMPRF